MYIHSRLFKNTCLSALAFAMMGAALPADAMTLRESVAVALESNPDIGQAIENREAIEFELRQARGLYMPSVDLEGSVGIRRLANPSRRALKIDDDPLYPTEASVVATQKLFDGGGRRAELKRQAARVDSASFRIMERSEYIGLQVTREYIEYFLQRAIVNEAIHNVNVHQRIYRNIGSAIEGGSLTQADRQQARERVLAATARLQEAREELKAAQIRFYRLVGKKLSRPKFPRSVARHLPSSLSRAIGIARGNNPRIHMAKADIDAADALVKAARSKYLPEISAEGRSRAGHDIDGADGRTTDLRARLVLKWNLYRGGINKANEQEQIRRVSEMRMVLHKIHREVEEAVRISWDRRLQRSRLAQILRMQVAQNNRLIASYRKQFSIGKRSLLDVLDAQNTYFNSRILAKSAEYASLFAEYRILASTGQLLSTLKLSAPKQTEAYARAEFKVPETAPTEIYPRVPSRQENKLPMDLLAPLNP